MNYGSYQDYRVSIRHAIDGDWFDVKSVAIGDVPERRPTPDRFVLVENGDGPIKRLDLYLPSSAYHFREDAVIWLHWVVVGYGDRVDLHSLKDGTSISLALNTHDSGSFSYFCGIESGPDYLLICSGIGIHCIGSSGTVAWRNDNLGLDGVLVHSVAGDIICGSGEWDPPGGWRDFRLSLNTGRAIG